MTEPPAGGWRAWGLGLGLLMAALGLRTWVFGLVRVPTASMAPTLLPGDVALYWRLGEPAVGDVLAMDRDDGVLHLKRLVATGGEEVEIADGRLYVNGLATLEPGAAQPVSWSETGRAAGDCRERAGAAAVEARAARRWRVLPGGDHAREVIPDGALFLLGDNRPDSSDSRQWGASPRASARGVVSAIVWSRSPCGEFRLDRVGSLH